MKRTRSRIAWAVALFSTACVVQPATAFYNPELGRWATRDPLGERGFEVLRHALDGESYSGDNLYTFVANDPCDNIDRNGLTLWLCSRKTDWGVGNHVYFWNDTPPSGDGPTCAMNRSSGRGNPNVPKPPRAGTSPRRP